tara:strand:+ start:159 stop:374 length:216 start_codon:yes stop_codon:yes gene_type:complete
LLKVIGTGGTLSQIITALVKDQISPQWEDLVQVCEDSPQTTADIILAGVRSEITIRLSLQYYPDVNEVPSS